MTGAHIEKAHDGPIHPIRNSKSSGIKLVPQPSADPRDPLNWPMWKKVSTLMIVCWAAFVSIAQATCNQADFPIQGKSYNVTSIQMSYTVSAAIAGLASGPIFWLLLIDHVGDGSCLFWGTLLTFACTIWGGLMTREDQYVAFTISRWLAGTFMSAASVTGAGTILNIFFLHQRGWAFSFFFISVIFGVNFGATSSGYIVQFVPWPVQFWWIAGAEASVLLFVFFLLPHTGFPRSSDDSSIVSQPVVERGYLAGRIAMFFPGTQVVYGKKRWRDTIAPLLILISPVTLVCGFFLFVTFGWYVGESTLLTVFLQSPISEGGYGFSPIQNANFLFCQWGGIILAEVYVFCLQDKVPLWFCRRRGGVWKPEYRLVTLGPLMVLLCVGLGTFGAALQYHLTVGALAAGTLLIAWAGTGIVPVVNNYLAECFTDHANYASAALNFYRLLLGLVLPFFIDPWVASVGYGWAFGMMAFFSIFAFAILGLLAWKGKEIRAMSPAHLQRSEEGEVIKRLGSDDFIVEAETRTG